MAKDLPYFKFFCSEWTDGDITLEDYETQGLFINICSYYWSNNCNLELIKLKKRFRNEPNIENLIETGIIKVNGDLISISFLDKQLTEREEQSSTKSKGGKASAEAKRLLKIQQQFSANSTENQHVLNYSSTENQHMLKSCSTESQLLREDKIREEEIREENKRKENINTASPFKFFDSLISLGGEKQLVSDWIAVRKLKKLTNTLTAFENFKIEVSKSGKTINEVLKECVVNSWGGFKAEWINKNNVTLPTKKRVIS